MNPENPPIIEPDPFGLARFLAAQEGVFDQASDELRRGRKQTHWMWFIFPQIRGLGSSPTATHYALTGIEEARAYLDHPLLGQRLIQCSEILLALAGRTAAEIFGSPDNLKLRSCMTLFSRVAGADSVFARVLQKYFEGAPDLRTLTILSDDASQSKGEHFPSSTHERRGRQ